MVLSIVGILSWALLSGRALRPVAAARIGRLPEPGFEDPQFPEAVTDQPLPAVGPTRRANLRQVEPPALQSDIPDAEIPLADVRAPAAAPMSPEFEQFRPNDAVAAIRALGGGIVAMISPQGGSLVTVDIARELETSSTRVAVIDLSADGSVSAEFLGQGMRSGLSELAQGKCGFAEAVYPDPLSSVQIMPAGDMARPDAALPFERVREIVAAMAESFDYLVIDCGDAGGDTLLGLLPLTSLVLVDSIRWRPPMSPPASRISQTADFAKPSPSPPEAALPSAGQSAAQSAQRADRVPQPSMLAHHALDRQRRARTDRQRQAGQAGRNDDVEHFDGTVAP